jgi:hypothetical protein
MDAPERRPGPAPYLFMSAIWLGVAHLAASMKTVQPVYVWILTQVLLLEKIPGHSRWVTELAWLAAYGGMGLFAWILVERPGSDPSRTWRRAAIAWLAIQVGYCIVAAALVELGVLYE